MLDCRIQPNANTDCFAEVIENRLKIRITASPVDGKANQHLIRFLSRQFKVPQKRIRIKRGNSNRDKCISILAPERLPPELKITNR